MTKFTIKIASVAVAALIPLAVAVAPAAAHGKPTVGCWSYQKGRAVHKVRPNSCALVVSLRGCNGGCAADQVYIDDCVWSGWGRRHAQAHCTERANGGFHRRHFVKLHLHRGCAGALSSARSSEPIRRSERNGA